MLIRICFKQSQTENLSVFFQLPKRINGKNKNSRVVFFNVITSAQNKNLIVRDKKEKIRNQIKLSIEPFIF